MYSDRNKDNIEEKILSLKLDKLYDRMGWNYKRTKRKSEMQLNGVDVIFEKENKKIFVDEKASTKYLNKNLKTFSFELISENNPNRKGWLLNKDNITTHYAIIYPKSKTNDLKHLDCLEWILISKERILNILYNNINFNDALNNVYSDIYLNKNTNRNEIYISCYDEIFNKYFKLKIVWSKNIFPEQPVNILFDKKDLIKLADKHLIIKYK